MRSSILPRQCDWLWREATFFPFFFSFFSPSGDSMVTPLFSAYHNVLLRWYGCCSVTVFFSLSNRFHIFWNSGNFLEILHCMSIANVQFVSSTAVWLWHMVSRLWWWPRPTSLCQNLTDVMKTPFLTVIQCSLHWAEKKLDTLPVKVQVQHLSFNAMSRGVLCVLLWEGLLWPCTAILNQEIFGLHTVC